LVIMNGDAAVRILLNPTLVGHNCSVPEHKIYPMDALIDFVRCCTD
jgi:hypothetical protein